MAELSQLTQRLIQQYQNWSQSLHPKEGIPTIHVDEVASSVASFYEKIRGIIEWREEHLLRETAIERILKRRLILKKREEKIAEPFILELIRGGHFSNNTIPEVKIEEIQKIIDKYAFILKNSNNKEQEKQKTQLLNWILGIAACEIEATLAPPIKEKALIDYMTEFMKERIKIKEGIFVIGGITEEQKNTQIYIACQRSLFKLDDSLIRYHLLNKKYSDWSNLSSPRLQEISENILNIHKSIEGDLQHPWGERIYNICERHDTSYLILGDIIAMNPSEAQKKLENPSVLENLIKETYGKRVIKLREKLNRAALYSTISIFITKIVSALAVEIPFDIYITQAFSYQTLGINIIFPPFLMFVLVKTIRPPKKGNLQKVIMEVIKITYETKKKDVYVAKKPAKRGIILNSIIIFFYLLGFLGSFGIIIWGLQRLNFGILSMAIFLLFLTMISYTGIKIRQRAKELIIQEEQETFLGMIFDFFSLPIIRVGRWISSQWQKHNAVIIIFNSLIDMPFQLFIEFLEQWRYFLKEKKDEIH